MGVAALSGLVRGFSGFGGAMIYMPLVAAVYEPRIAAVTILLVDFFSSTPFALGQLRRCTWKEVTPISIATGIAAPFGAWALLVLDPTMLRWGIALLVLSLLPFLVSGWRYRGEPKLPVTVGVGLFAGVCAGAVQIAGPPVIMYWMSRGNSAATMRANLMVYFLFCGLTITISYLWFGLFTVPLVALAIMLGIPYLAGVAVGAYVFRGSSDLLYRRVAYVIIALAALLSLPVLDPVFRASSP
jgi:uncharacterized membrane protein YfcA